MALINSGTAFTGDRSCEWPATACGWCQSFGSPHSVGLNKSDLPPSRVLQLTLPPWCTVLWPNSLCCFHFTSTMHILAGYLCAHKSSTWLHLKQFKRYSCIPTALTFAITASLVNVLQDDLLLANILLQGDKTYDKYPQIYPFTNLLQPTRSHGPCSSLNGIHLCTLSTLRPPPFHITKCFSMISHL